MITQLRAVLERAEFDAIETEVRYYEEVASAKDVAAVKERLHDLRTVARSLEQATLELFAFPRRPEPSGVSAGH